MRFLNRNELQLNHLFREELLDVTSMGITIYVLNVLGELFTVMVN